MICSTSLRLYPPCDELPEVRGRGGVRATPRFATQRCLDASEDDGEGEVLRRRGRDVLAEGVAVAAVFTLDNEELVRERADVPHGAADLVAEGAAQRLRSGHGDGVPAHMRRPAPIGRAPEGPSGGGVPGIPTGVVSDPGHPAPWTDRTLSCPPETRPPLAGTCLSDTVRRQ
jgi:hypothetical protein